MYLTFIHGQIIPRCHFQICGFCPQDGDASLSERRIHIAGLPNGWQDGTESRLLQNLLRTGRKFATSSGGFTWLLKVLA